MHAKRIVRALRRAARWSRSTKGEARTKALALVPTTVPRHLHMMDFRTPPGWEGYCPNAGTIRALLAGAGVSRVKIAPFRDRRQSA